MNNIIAKPIPGEMPQWQMTVMPVKNEDAFYLLVRIHHLYASEDGVGLSDLLLLRPDETAGWKHEASPQSLGYNGDADSIQNILSTVYQAPTALPRLGEHMSEICANAWNELVSTYDPLENPKVFKGRPNVFVFTAMMAIVTASVARDKSPKRNVARKFRRELSRRDIRFRYMLSSLVNTLHPALWVSIVWWLMVKCVLRLPITLLLVLKNTSTYVYWTYVVLYSVSEMVYLIRLVYRAPGSVIRELVLPFFSRRASATGGLPLPPPPPDKDNKRPDADGAKSVYWSKPINLERVGTIHDNTGAATCEIQLSMLAAVLQRHFADQGVRFESTKTVMTTTRFVSKSSLFQLNNRNAVTNGLLALPLPMDNDTGDPIFSLHQMQECLQEAISNQTALYIASMWQIDHSLATSFLPSPVVNRGLQSLSKKYPLSVTYVEENRQDRRRRRLLWGQEVDAILYWRPPQSNVCE